jgi:hypothetical protein
VFDAHQDVSYRRKNPLDTVKCRDPIAMGLVLDSRNVWRTQDGVVSAALQSSRINTARRKGKRK